MGTEYLELQSILGVIDRHISLADRPVLEVAPKKQLAAELSSSMDHTHIVPASEISKYSDRIVSRSAIPELIYLLIKQSCLDATECRIPYGDEVNQIGLDGRVATATGFSIFVPKGTSYWEIGTGADAQEKATTDFRNRTNELSQAQRANATFVFVTSRAASAGEWTEPKQAAWIRRRRNKGWGGIQIIDAGGGSTPFPRTV